MTARDLTGQRIGRLVVLEKAKSRTSPSGCKRTYWLCRCDCGRIKEIAASSLLSGATTSCGCLLKEKLSEASKTHGKSKTRLYRIWCAMKARCENENYSTFYNYGARGISVCNEWRTDFTNFESWAYTHGYNDSLSIDRIDNSKGYNPSNCRWIPLEEQSRNRRGTIRITAYGQTLNPVEWSRKLNIPYATIVYRYHRGLPPEEILRGGGDDGRS